MRVVPTHARRATNHGRTYTRRKRRQARWRLRLRLRLRRPDYEVGVRIMDIPDLEIWEASLCAVEALLAAEIEELFATPTNSAKAAARRDARSENLSISLRACRTGLSAFSGSAYDLVTCRLG